MRCATAAQIKGYKKGAPLSSAPREGGELRAVYDLFMANKGTPVEITLSVIMHGGRSIEQLRDIWGLDIRRIRNGSSRTGRQSTYILAGEWFGKVYVDYVAERMEAAQ